MKITIASGPMSFRNIIDAQNDNSKIIFFRTGVSCGFPSPADDFLEKSIDLSEHLIKHPAATFIVVADGDSMQGVGIYSGDKLIVDRSLEPIHGDIVIVSIDGQLTCKQLDLDHKCFRSANPEVSDIAIEDDLDIICEGVVTYCLHSLDFRDSRRVRPV